MSINPNESVSGTSEVTNDGWFFLIVLDGGFVGGIKSQGNHVFQDK